MPSIEHTCTACGRVLEVVKRRPLVIGRPFLECSQCGALTIRDGYHEWQMMRAADRVQLVGSGACFALALGLLPAFVYGVAATVTSGRLDWTTVSVLAALGALVALAAWGARCVSEVRRSQRRMADPMYLAQLARFGIDAAGALRGDPRA